MHCDDCIAWILALRVNMTCVWRENVDADRTMMLIDMYDTLGG